MRMWKRLLVVVAVIFVVFQFAIWIILTARSRESSITNRQQAGVNTWISSNSRPYTLTFEEPPNLPWDYKTRSAHSETSGNSRFVNANNYHTHDPNLPKLILFYNPPSWYENQMCSRGINMCPVKSCQCSTNPKELSQADAVVIEGIHIETTNPPTKLANQVWIFFGLESPIYYQTPFYKSEKWRQLFNWTMTYRLDSDIPIPYDILVRQPSLNKNYTEISLHKSKSAVWIVSHCTTSSKREDYVNELRQYYDVDIYGECGKPCTFQNCGKELETDYRFYLSFENSFCVDYVTEKLFKVYESKMDMIPIVLGGADYRSLLPNGTYINTASFSSPKQLAEYLKYLEKNVTAYAELLGKKHQYVRHGQPGHLYSGFCDICVKMNNIDKFHNYYHDSAKWLKENTCFPQIDSTNIFNKLLNIFISL